MQPRRLAGRLLADRFLAGRAAVLPLVASASLLALSALACSASPGNTTDSGNGGSGNGSAGGNGGNGGNGGSGAGIAAGGSMGSTITESCGASTFANQVPGSILVVLDKSGSMSGGDGQPDKWGPCVDALKVMMGSASPALGVGLLPFPEGNFDDSGLIGCAFNPNTPACMALFADGGCEDVATTPAVAVAPLSLSQSQIAGWLDSHDPGGNTPTLAALKNGYAILQGADVPGERFVLLMTDGEPTTHQPASFIPESNVKCGNLSDIEAAAAAAAAASPKVKTFVIGSPGSEGAGEFLSQLAINGQTQKSANCSAAAKDCHYQIGKANYQQELEAALADIAGKLSECVFEIPDGENADPNYVNVNIEASGTTTQLFKDTSHSDGWDYTDDSHTKVELFGPACDEFKSEQGAQVSIILGCETIAK